MQGSRVTDVVQHFAQREEMRPAVEAVRNREPERFRWRKAVGTLLVGAATKRGRDRSRIEEPLREVVVDLSDRALRREVILDGKRVGVDLDRGEILPWRSVGDVRRIAVQSGVDLPMLKNYVVLPDSPASAVDTGLLVVVSRGLGEHYKMRANKLLLELPEAELANEERLHHRIMRERAEQERQRSLQWFAFTKSMLGD